MSTPEVVVLGTLCEDLFPSFAVEPSLPPGGLLEVGPLRAQAGGCVANTGLALVDLGTRVRAVADVGEDTVGEILLADLVARGLDIDGVRRVPGESTAYSVVLEGSGDRCIWHHPGACARLDAADVDVDGAAALHVGYPSLLDRFTCDGGRALAELFTRSRSRGAVTSLDLAVVAPGSASSAVAWQSWLERVLPCTDVFAPSRDDLVSVGVVADDAQNHGLVAVARRLLARGSAVVMVKCSLGGLLLATGSAHRLRAAGAALRDHAEQWCDRVLWTPALDVGGHGPTGAGDAAVAGLLHGIAAGMSPQDALRCAAAVAAARVESGGPVVPWSVLRARLDAGWPHHAAQPPAGCEVVGGAPRVLMGRSTAGTRRAAH